MLLGSPLYQIRFLLLHFTLTTWQIIVKFCFFLSFMTELRILLKEVLFIAYCPFYKIILNNLLLFFKKVKLFKY